MTVVEIRELLCRKKNVFTKIIVQVSACAQNTTFKNDFNKSGR
jgi:hypothetical protein